MSEDYLNRIVQDGILRLSNHTSRLIRKLDKRYYLYTKVGIIKKRDLLANIPDLSTRLSIYMDTVYWYIKNNAVDTTPAEYEMLLHTLGLVKDGFICKDNNRQNWEMAMKIL